MILVASIVDDEDKAEARRVGRARFERAVALGRSQPYGDPGSEKRLFIDCYSSLAELAVARYLGIEWRKELVDDLRLKPPDVGENIEVRWSPRRWGHLIGHPEDRDDWYMVSVRGELPEMAIIGWALASEVKQECYRNNPKARNPPQEFWMPIEDLLAPELMKERIGS